MISALALAAALSPVAQAQTTPAKPKTTPDTASSRAAAPRDTTPSNRNRTPRPETARPAAGRTAAEVATLHVTQAAGPLPALRVFFDARTDDDRRAARPSASNVRLTVGSRAATVESVAPVAAADGVAYVFLVDVSRSLRPRDFEQVQQAIAQWIDRMHAADRVAVVAFGKTVRVVHDFTGDKGAARAAVDNLTPNEAETGLHEALVRGADLARRQDDGLPVRRAVVVLSDGLDDFPGGVQRDEVLRAFQHNPVPLYALGVRAPGGDAAGLDALGGFARASGGALLRVNESDVAAAFDSLRTRLGEAFVAAATCEACAADGTVQRVQLTLSTNDGRTLSDGLDVRFVPPPDSSATPADSSARPDQTKRDGLPAWLYGLAALLATALAAAWLLARRRKSATPPAPAAPETVAPAPAAPRPPEDVAASIAREDARLGPLPGPAVAAKVDDPAPTVAVRVDDPAPAPPVSPPAPGVADPPIPELPAVVAPVAPVSPPPDPVVLRFTPMRGGTPQRLTLRDEALVGRSAAKADVVIGDDASVSGRHARLVNTPGGVLISDAGSTNGTIVNGVPLAGPRRLEHGDLVRIGQTELRVTFER